MVCSSLKRGSFPISLLTPSLIPRGSCSNRRIRNAEKRLDAKCVCTDTNFNALSEKKNGWKSLATTAREPKSKKKRKNKTANGPQTHKPGELQVAPPLDTTQTLNTAKQQLQRRRGQRTGGRGKISFGGKWGRMAGQHTRIAGTKS